MYNKSIKINIPKFPKYIIEKLENNGFQAYIVGGCVRDILLGRKVDDFDITTNAKPEQIKKIFKKTIDTGIKHGTVTVLFYENNFPLTFEVTTFRIDGKYEDSRHPKDVQYVNDLREDLLRRDFTINAMAYNDRVGLVDEFGGIEDLKNKIIRAVGNPIERFTEDALRLLRAIRFAAKLGFEIENKTKNAIPALAEKIVNVSKERIQVELTKTITSENPEIVNLIFELNIAKYINDKFADIKIGKITNNLPKHLAYACLFYNTVVNIAKNILLDLKFDKNNMNKTLMLLIALSYLNNNDLLITTKEIINYLKYDLVYDFIYLLKINNYNNNVIDKMKEYVNYFKQNNIPIFINDLDVNGNDLFGIGLQGMDIGKMLLYLQKKVFVEPSINKKEILLEIAKKKKEE